VPAPRWLLPAVLALVLALAGSLSYIAGRGEVGETRTTLRETITVTMSVRVVETATLTLSPPPPGYAIVFMGGAVVYAEVPKTPKEFARGLSGRERLEEGRGMLFIFEREGLHSFWMYGMRFRIDIVWMDSMGRVVYIVERAEPCSGEDCTVYTPPVEARYVLELPEGFASRHRITLGERALIYLSDSGG
jgi:uncharacterized membrane protein (UPF0127 family)